MIGSGAVGTFDDLTPEQLIALEHDAKVRLMEHIAGEILMLRIEYAKAAARFAEIDGKLKALVEVKSALELTLAVGPSRVSA